MLWLPLQGTFVSATPLCTHEENTHNKLNSNVILIVDVLFNTIHHEQSIDNSLSSNQGCEVNTFCHASCSVVIVSARSTAISIDSLSLTISPISQPISFIPEQLQRPPRA